MKLYQQLWRIGSKLSRDNLWNANSPADNVHIRGQATLLQSDQEESAAIAYQRERQEPYLTVLAVVTSRY
jgi:hypothetical protein